jgi:excisionase family DNA binding protein
MLNHTPTGKQSDGPALPRLAYTMRETAAVLGVNYQTVYRLAKRGKLRSSGGLRTKLFPVAEIERFLHTTTA